MRAYEGSRGIAPLFLKLGAWWKWVGNITPRPLYPQQRSPFPFDLLLDAWWAPEVVWRRGEEKNIIPLTGFEPRNVLMFNM
jgi:hypothetical protein